MLDVTRVAAKLAELRRRDQELKVLGASSHRYVLEPTLDEQALATFERAHAISLPDDYRAFLGRLGNGGAGPFHGVFPLGEMDDGPRFKRWDGGFVGPLRGRFPHEDPPESGQFEGPIDGAIPICHLGGAVRTWLVVSGPERGNVWLDARAEGDWLRPHQTGDGVHLTFAAWYEGWLDKSLASRLVDP
jgi:hypothetical protein